MLIGNVSFRGEREKPIKSLTLRDIHNVVELKDYAGPELKAGHAEAVQHYRIKSGSLHNLRHRAGWMGHLRAANSLPASTGITTSRVDADTENRFLEMGAIRGMFGRRLPEELQLLLDTR
jgi:hypothetical protein